MSVPCNKFDHVSYFCLTTEIKKISYSFLFKTKLWVTFKIYVIYSLLYAFSHSNCILTCSILWNLSEKIVFLYVNFGPWMGDRPFNVDQEQSKAVRL